MKRAPWLYTLMQIALWSIHGVLISYAQRYLAGMGMRDSAIGLLLGGALLDASGVPLLLTVCTIVSAVGAAIVWCAVQTKKHAAC